MFSGRFCTNNIWFGSFSPWTTGLCPDIDGPPYGIGILDGSSKAGLPYPDPEFIPAWPGIMREGPPIVLDPIRTCSRNEISL